MESRRKRKPFRGDGATSPTLLEVRSKIQKRNEEIDLKYQKILDGSSERYNTALKMQNEWIKENDAKDHLYGEDTAVIDNQIALKGARKRVLASDARDCWTEHANSCTLLSTTTPEIDAHHGKSKVELCESNTTSGTLTLSIPAAQSMNSRKEFNDWTITEEGTTCLASDSPSYEGVSVIEENATTLASAYEEDNLAKVLWHLVNQLTSSISASKGQNVLHVLKCLLDNSKVLNAKKTKYYNSPRKRIKALGDKYKGTVKSNHLVSKHMQRYFGVAETCKRETLQCIESFKKYWCQTRDLKADIRGMISGFYSQIQQEYVSLAKEHQDIYSEMLLTTQKDMKCFSQDESEQIKYLSDKVREFRDQIDKLERQVEGNRFEEVHRTCAAPYEFEMRRHKLTAYRSRCPEVEVDPEMSCASVNDSKEKKHTNRFTRMVARCFGKRENTAEETQLLPKLSPCMYVEKYHEALATIDRINLKCEGLKEEAHELQTMYSEQSNQNRHLHNDMDGWQRQLASSRNTVTSLKEHIRNLLDIRYRYISDRLNCSGYHDDCDCKMNAELNEQRLFLRCLDNFKEELFKESGENKHPNVAEIPVNSFPPKIEEMIVRMTDKLHHHFETQIKQLDNFDVIEEAFRSNINVLIECCRYLKDHYTEGARQIAKPDKLLVKECGTLKSSQRKVTNAKVSSKIKRHDVRESKELRALRAKVAAKNRTIAKLRKKNKQLSSDLDNVQEVVYKDVPSDIKVEGACRDRGNEVETVSAEYKGIGAKENVCELEHLGQDKSHLPMPRSIVTSKTSVHQRLMQEDEDVTTREISTGGYLAANVVDDVSTRQPTNEKNQTVASDKLCKDKDCHRPTAGFISVMGMNRHRGKTKRVQHTLFTDSGMPEESNINTLRQLIQDQDGNARSKSSSGTGHQRRRQNKKMSEKHMRKTRQVVKKRRRGASSDELGDPGGYGKNSHCQGRSY